MIKKRILFTGASSLLGVNWFPLINNYYKIYIAIHKKDILIPDTKRVFLNYNSNKELIDSISNIKPDIIINLAGLTNIETCESNKSLADEVNVVLPTKLSYCCNYLNIKFIHISTDHLYDGKNSFYKEESITHPLNYYALTKRKAEIAILEKNITALIIRTNFFGWGPTYRISFSDFIINSLRLQNKVYLFEDVYFNPILISELVKKIHKLIDVNALGIFNIVSDEKISKLSFGLKIAEVFDLNKKLIIKSSINDSKLTVLRPKDMTLSNAKYKTLIANNDFLSFTDQLKELFNQEKKDIFNIIKRL